MVRIHFDSLQKHLISFTVVIFYTFCNKQKQCRNSKKHKSTKATNWLYCALDVSMHICAVKGLIQMARPLMVSQVISVTHNCPPHLNKISVGLPLPHSRSSACSLHMSKLSYWRFFFFTPHKGKHFSYVKNYTCKSVAPTLTC